MDIQNDKELIKAITYAGELIQSIQNYIGPVDPEKYDSSEYRIRIPWGYIRTREKFDKKFFYVEDSVIRGNFCYLCQLLDFYTWVLNRTNVSLSVRSLLIKQAIFNMGCLVDDLIKSVAKREAIPKKTNKAKWLIENERLKVSYKELDQLVDQRNNIHLHKVNKLEYSSYDDDKLNEARLTTEKVIDSFKEYYSLNK